MTAVVLPRWLTRTRSACGYNCCKNSPIFHEFDLIAVDEIAFDRPKGAVLNGRIWDGLIGFHDTGQNDIVRRNRVWRLILEPEEMGSIFIQSAGVRRKWR